MSVQTLVPNPRGDFRYNPTVAPATSQADLPDSSVGFNPWGLLAGLPAIPSLLSYGSKVDLPIGKEDIYNLFSNVRNRAAGSMDQTQKQLLSSLYGRGLYKSGATVGDIANLRGREAEIGANIDAQMAQSLMGLNQQELQAGMAQKQAQGDIGQLFASLATVLPFLL